MTKFGRDGYLSSLVRLHATPVKIFRISGEPFPYGTASQGSIEWKQVLNRNILANDIENHPSPSEIGLTIDFTFDPALHKHRPLDVENLCEYVFQVLVGTKKWFGGKKTNIRWIKSSVKSIGKSGCILRLFDCIPFDIACIEQSIFCQEGMQGLPVDARDDKFIDTIQSKFRGSALENNHKCHVELYFPSNNVNLGEIANGHAKHVIDCLSPVLGLDSRGQTADNRIQTLYLSKGDEKSIPDKVSIWVAKV